MISTDVEKLEQENRILKEALEELSRKMENNEVPKPKTCQYCKYYMQHYIKGVLPMHTEEYVEIYEGHCTRGVPIKKGGKRSAKPDDTCSFFEIGNKKMEIYL